MGLILSKYMKLSKCFLIRSCEINKPKLENTQYNIYEFFGTLKELSAKTNSKYGLGDNYIVM